MTTKSNEVTVYELTKDGFTFVETFRKSAVKAALDVNSLFQDVTPIGVSLWKTYKVMVKDGLKGKDANGKEVIHQITRLAFYRALDPTIPAEWGKVGSAERKIVDSHVVLNKLTYLTMTIGRQAVEGKPKRDPKVAQAKAKNDMIAFGQWSKRFKIPANALQILVRDIMGMHKKDEKTLTTKGNNWLKAAGMQVEEVK